MQLLHPSTDIVEAAQQYIKLGLPIIPLRGKTPAISQWQLFTANAVNLRFWFGNKRCNIGLRTGESGYVVVDTDTDAAEEWARTRLSVTPVMARSGSGSIHRYFQTPPRKAIRNRQAWKGIHGLDIRGQGGFIVMPPSIHPDTGKKYEWLAPLSPPDQLPRFSPTWIYIRRQRQLVQEVLEASPDFRLLRATRWLEKRDGAISGRRGHDHTFATACKLVLYFGLDRETAIQLMMSIFNPRCQPEWSLGEIEHKVDDALKKRK